jgi:uncharacterized protein YlxP (DUF503 family)
VFVGVIQAEFLLRGSRSLKDRRRVIRSIKDRTRQRFHASVAEVGDLELWQRATLGVALVGNERGFVDRSLQEILRSFRAVLDAELIDHQVDIL